MDENTVIQGIKEGDSGAFHQLYMEHSERIYRLAFRYTRSQTDAEDVMQETFVKAFKQIHKFSGDRTAVFASWLSRICVNCSIDFLRKQKRQHTGDTISLDELLVEPEAGGESAQRRAEIREACDMIAAAAEQLSPKQRVVFDLRYSQHHTITEIAGLLDCSENAVKTHLSRSVKILKATLKPVWSER